MKTTPSYQVLQGNTAEQCEYCGESSARQRVNEDKVLAQLVYDAGRRHGEIDGHRLGFDQGYLCGFGDGTRNNTNYLQGAKDGYLDGYQDGKADQQHIYREAA